MSAAFWGAVAQAARLGMEFALRQLPELEQTIVDQTRAAWSHSPARGVVLGARPNAGEHR